MCVNKNIYFFFSSVFSVYSVVVPIRTVWILADGGIDGEEHILVVIYILVYREQYFPCVRGVQHPSMVVLVVELYLQWFQGQSHRVRPCVFYFWFISFQFLVLVCLSCVTGPVVLFPYVERVSPLARVLEIIYIYIYIIGVFNQKCDYNITQEEMIKSVKYARPCSAHKNKLS